MRVHHLALRTADPARLRSFYEGVLGLPVTRESGESVWLDAAGTIVMLERAAPGEPGVPSATRELVAFAIAAAERGAFEARLEARGIPVEARTAFTLYFRDPDGRRVGVSHHPDPAPG